MGEWENGAGVGFIGCIGFIRGGYFELQLHFIRPNETNGTNDTSDLSPIPPFPNSTIPPFHHPHPPLFRLARLMGARHNEPIMSHWGRHSWIGYVGCGALLLSLLPALAYTAPLGRPRGRGAAVPAPVVPSAPVPVATPAAAPAPAVVAPAAGSAEPSAFDRYQVILSRMPFGDEAAAAAAAAAANASAAAAAADSFTKNLKLCAITRNHFNKRVQVGLLDAVTKKSYFLYEGDMEDGIEVKAADFENEKALVKKGAEEVWMTMSAVAAAAPVVTRGPAGIRMGAAPAPDAFETPKDPTIVDKNLRVVDHTKNVPKLPAAELQKRLQDYQMDLIRAAGQKGPPLPMQLTPEMDAQLVKEGALPPTE